MAKIEEANSKMAGGKGSLHVNRRTRPYYSRRCKSRHSSTNIESLPDDLVFRILLLLSVQDLYDMARFVCRKWYNIIRTDNFIYAHLQHSVSGLLFKHKNDWYQPIFMTVREGRVAISMFSFECHGLLVPDCNGLIIRRGERAYHIVNPATKQLLFVLPDVPYFPCVSMNLCNMGFAPTSMEYKVVWTLISDDQLECLILTVGVDKSWRSLCTQHLPSAALKLINGFAVVTDGYMHWFDWVHTHFLTLNIETEIFTETPLPQGCGEKPKYLLQSSGRYVSLLVGINNYLWEVWEMKPEDGEWTKLHNIKLEADNCRVQKVMNEGSFLQPKGWVKYKESNF